MPPCISALAENPAIVSAFHNVDAAELQVKVAEAALGPNSRCKRQVQLQWDMISVSNDQLVNALR